MSKQVTLGSAARENLVKGIDILAKQLLKQQKKQVMVQQLLRYWHVKW